MRVVLHFYNRRHNPAIIQSLVNKGFEVHCVIIEMGEKFDFNSIKKEIIKSGGKDVIYVDGRNEFSEKFLLPLIESNAIYQSKYFLSAAISRPFISEVCGKIAKSVGAKFIAHGFRGNDLVRMNMAISSIGFQPIAALSELDISDEEIDRCAIKINIPDVFGQCNPFSVSENIWGRSIECGVLQDLEQSSDINIPRWVNKGDSIVKDRLNISISFEKGIPVALDDRRLSLLDIIEELNKVAGVRGVGSFDMVEDGYVGLKTRAIYEHPAAFCLVTAHKELEAIVLNRHERLLKSDIDSKFSEFIYAGLWIDPVITHLRSILKSFSYKLNGTITLSLNLAQIEILKRYSANSLYEVDKSIFNYGHTFSKLDAISFARTFSLHSISSNEVNERIK